jgi:hypothetical protein
MNFLRRIAVLALIALLAAGSLELGASLGVPGIHGYVSKAHARVGRPLSPVSVAGAGRRTVRRCAAGVYNC